MPYALIAAFVALTVLALTVDIARGAAPETAPMPGIKPVPPADCVHKHALVRAMQPFPTHQSDIAALKARFPSCFGITRNG